MFYYLIFLVHLVILFFFFLIIFNIPGLKLLVNEFEPCLGRIKTTVIAFNGEDLY